MISKCVNGSMFVDLSSMQAWKQPSFKESVKAHWIFEQMDLKMYRNLRTLFAEITSSLYMNGSGMFRILFVYLLRDILKIGSNNVDVSSDKKCEKHFHRKFKGF